MSRQWVRGVVHGKTIELAEDLGLAEGQEVEVTVKPVPKAGRQPGEGFLRTAGAPGAQSTSGGAADGTSLSGGPRTLEQLLERVNKSNIHHEVDMGPAVGEEVW